MSSENSQIHDILYLDFEKASSIWSQFQWGKLKEISIESENSINSGAEGKIGIPNIAKVGLNVEEGEKRRILETRILHHDLLNRIISLLNEKDYLVELKKHISPDETSAHVIRDTIGEHPYIIACGWSVFEDYKKILEFSDKFLELSQFINKSSISSSSQYKDLKKIIVDKKSTIEGIKDQNSKSKEKRKVSELEKSLQKMLDVKEPAVEQWILDGIKLWITTFMPTRLNFRVYPFEKCPSFQILCNLKHECFVDQDFDHLLYGYSNQPNVPLSIFGLITSLPKENGKNFDLMKEFDNYDHLSPEMNLEKAFRNLFSSKRNFEDFIQYSRYPNITVHPIAVFRSF